MFIAFFAKVLRRAVDIERELLPVYGADVVVRPHPAFLGEDRPPLAPSVHFRLHPFEIALRPVDFFDVPLHPLDIVRVQNKVRV